MAATSELDGSGELVVTRPVSQVLLLRIHRPSRRNALHFALRAEIADCFTRASDDPEIRVVIITGGDDFAAGADVTELAELGPIELMAKRVHRYWQAVAECPKPVIAAIEGLALGGGLELALCADIVIAGEGARVGFPEIKLGIFPGGGGTQRILTRVSLATACLLLFTGRLITATEAFQRGLISELVPTGKAVEAAIGMAESIAQMPPLALAQLKEVLLVAHDVPLSAGLKLERSAFNVLFASEDQKEGMRAFLSKQKPNFQGR